MILSFSDNKNARVYVAGHSGLVGSAILRLLKEKGYTNLICRPSSQLDLRDHAAVKAFFENEKPEYIFLAAAKVGGIMANNTYPADFIYDNLVIQNNIIHQAYMHGAKKLLFLGSSCIYPKNSAQPIKEEYLLTGFLDLPKGRRHVFHVVVEHAGLRLDLADRPHRAIVIYALRALGVGGQASAPGYGHRQHCCCKNSFHFGTPGPTSFDIASIDAAAMRGARTQ